MPSGWVDGGSNSLAGSTCPCILTTALGQMFRSSLFCCPCSSLPPIPLGAAFPKGKHSTPPPRSHQGWFSREGQRCHCHLLVTTGTWLRSLLKGVSSLRRGPGAPLAPAWHCQLATQLSQQLSAEGMFTRRTGRFLFTPSDVSIYYYYISIYLLQVMLVSTITIFLFISPWIFCDFVFCRCSCIILYIDIHSY